MPKVILGEQNRRNAALVDYINDHVGAGRQYRYDADLADALGLSPQTFSGRRKFPLRFGYAELCVLFHKTHASGKDLCKIFGVKE